MNRRTRAENETRDGLVTRGAKIVEPDESLAILLAEEVAPLAHAIWVGRGMPDGTDREDWFEAERQLRNELGKTPSLTPDVSAEQLREANESQQARGTGPSNRSRMVAIGRGNQQAGRQGS
jgi:Protein of unknown function (DUF2934)